MKIFFNLLENIFKIIQKSGWIEEIKCDERLSSYLTSAFLLIAIFGAMYGIAIGISVSKAVLVKNLIKVPLVLLGSFFLSIPAFYISSKFVGVEENPIQITAAIIPFFLVTSLILGIASPIIFFYSLATSFSETLGFIHLILVTVAVMVGLYFLGMTFIHSINLEKQKLAIPLTIGVVFIILAAIALIYFFHPFFVDKPYFCEGLERFLKIWFYKK